MKALSYARAALQLSPGAFDEAEVLKASKEVMGLSGQEVAMRLLRRFRLEEASRVRMPDFGVTTPWEAFVQMQLQILSSRCLKWPISRRSQMVCACGKILRACR